MYKMIVVDDEPFTRKGIRNLTDWPAMQIVLCGEAANGYEALDLVEQHAPDIVICDVKMPRMDGITFVSKMRQILPQVQIIFLSGYSDKEFLKSAIRFGAVDYVDKPFEPYELIEAVEKAKQAVNRPHHEEIDRDAAVRIILSEQDPPGNLPVDFEQDFISLVMRLDRRISGQDIELVTRIVLTDAYYSSVYSSLQRIFGHTVLLSPLLSGFVVHANLNDRPASLLLDQISQQFCNLVQTDSLFFIGASDVQRGSAQIKKAYNQAYSASHAVFFLGYGNMVHYREVRKSCFCRDIAAEESIRQAVLRRDIPLADILLDAYLEQMRRASLDDIALIREILADFGCCFATDQVEKVKVLQMIPAFETLKEIGDYLTSLLQKRVQPADGHGQPDKIIENIEQFIRKHFAEDLSLKAVADHVYLSPTYLCYVYKKHTGRTLGDFIAETKIQHACELLKDPALRICDIAGMLGFTCQDYFTKLFIRRRGITPSNYRSERLIK